MVIELNIHLKLRDTSCYQRSVVNNKINEVISVFSLKLAYIYMLSSEANRSSKVTSYCSLWRASDSSQQDLQS